MLGGIGNEVPATVGQSLIGSYSDFPCVKRAFICESGSVTTEMIDVVSGARLASMPWTMTSPFSSYMNVLNETVHHNIALAAGSWPQVGRNSSIWLLSGRFDGVYSFGFGDSTPNNIEIVLTVDGTGNPYVFAKFISGQLLTMSITTGVLSSTTTCLMGLIINEDFGAFEMFIVNASGVYISSTAQIADYANYVGCNLPATYSIGRDVVTSGLSGIVDLSLISVIEFANGLPSTYQADLTELSANFAAGRKVFPANWKGRS